MRSTWTDSRLDDLKDKVDGIDEKVVLLDKKVDGGFARLDTKFDEGFARLDAKIDGGLSRVDGRIDQVAERIDHLNQSLVHGMIALISIITVLLAAFLTVFASHF